MKVFALASLALASTSLAAQTLHSNHDQAEHHREVDHHDSLTHIEVLTVHGQNTGNIWNEAVDSVTVLEGDQLAKQAQPTLGETLSKEIGISSTQFGPNASRPVIRGLGGNRIRILQDGLGIQDLSGASQDHAIPINPLVSERVEVVRGPLNLLYGSSAIGGVVNVVTSRIHKTYHEHTAGGVDLKTNTSNNGQTMAMNLDYGSNNVMLHLDGDMGQSDNLKSPKEEIQNSKYHQKSYSVGTSYFVDDKTYVGVGYSLYDNRYGTVAEADVEIAMKQQRVDFVANHELEGFFTDIRLKSAQTFYKHTEFEGTSVGTKFNNKGNESRLELYHRWSDQMTGILGAQAIISDFKAQGTEAFLPQSKSQQYALFLFEQLQRRWGKINLGARYESSQVKSKAGTVLTSDKSKDFSSFSTALGMLFNLSHNLTTTLNFSYNERALTFQELYSKGSHVALGKYVIGNEDLNKEKSLSAEWSLRMKTQKTEGILNLFNQDFTNYIALNPTGATTNGMATYKYQQNKAMIYGAELSFSHFLSSNFQWTLKGDYLRGRNETSHENLARMTPMRLIGEIRYIGDYLNTGLQVQRFFKQRNTATNETSTSGYTMINLDFSQDLKVDDQSIMIYGQLNNLTNAVAINHVSLLKDKMRMAQRHIVVGLRAAF